MQLEIKLSTKGFLRKIRKWNKAMRERLLINNPQSYAKFTRTN